MAFSSKIKPTSLPAAIYDQKGRYWTRDAVDQLIVGRIHGGYTWTPIVLYLSRLHRKHLSSVTADEVEAFFDNIVSMSMHLLEVWMAKTSDDEDVREILKEIRGELVQAGSKFLAKK